MSGPRIVENDASRRRLDDVCFRPIVGQAMLRSMARREYAAVVPHSGGGPAFLRCEPSLTRVAPFSLVNSVMQTLRWTATEKPLES